LKSNIRVGFTWGSTTAVPTLPEDPAGEGFDIKKAASMNGTIKTLRADKGFGFILGDDNQEYFVHRSAVRGEAFEQLREGQAVAFDGSRGDKGLRAENVRLV
jgi:CspA family cold shock protein